MKRATILLLILLGIYLAAAAFAPCDGSCSQSEEVRRG